MKPVVVASLEDASGRRCVDIVRYKDGEFTFRERTRDERDADNWKHPPTGRSRVFESASSAWDAAKRDVYWLE